MDDREKVFHGLESCSCDAGVPNLCEVTECPYRGDAMCQHNLIRDALELLKAQEPRLITKDDFEKADAWGTIPAWIEYNPAIEGAEPGWAIIDIDIFGSPFKKAWTSRPTDEQREKVKWNDTETSC